VPHTGAGTCTICADLAEAIGLLDVTTEGIETGSWSIHVIHRACRFLSRTRHYTEETLCE
jgi:hypothetical protein